MLKTVSSITNAIGALNFKGTWNAATNTPTIVSGVGVKGDYFVVSVAGSTTIDGISNWGIGDWITYNGTVWQRVEGGADLNGVNITFTGSASGPTYETSNAAAGLTIANNDIPADGTDANIDIDITPKGIGEVNLPKVDIDAGAIDGVTLGTNSAVTEAQIDNININGNTIASTNTDGNIVLAPNGTGDVQVDADTLRVGDSGSDATIQSNGNADLILKTGNATTGSVTLADGTDGNLTIALNGSGKMLATNGGAFFGTATNSGNGAIMESGSNANGSFIKFADGTMICSRQFSSTTVSALTVSGVINWTYPVAFTAIPVISVALKVDFSGTNEAGWFTGDSSAADTVSATRFLIRNPSGGSVTYLPYATAIGKWY